MASLKEHRRLSVNSNLRALVSKLLKQERIAESDKAVVADYVSGIQDNSFCISVLSAEYMIPRFRQKLNGGA